MNKQTANLICLLVAVIWGGGFIAAYAALETFSPFALLMLRFCGAAVLSFLLLFLTKTKITRSAALKGALCGVLMYGGFAFQTFGLALTNTGTNAFLTAVNVVLVPFISWMAFRKRPPKTAFAAAVVCLAGIGLMSVKAGEFSFGFGDLLSLICAFFFAGQIVSLEWACQNENSTAVNAMQMLAAAVVSIPFFLFQESIPEHVSMSALASLFYLIFVSTFLAFLLQTCAQKYTDASSASLLLCTESLWANLFGWIILHETKTPAMIAGGLLIFAAVVMCESESLFNRKVQNV